MEILNYFSNRKDQSASIIIKKVYSQIEIFIKKIYLISEYGLVKPRLHMQV